jgi:hypothetical protein
MVVVGSCGIEEHFVAAGEAGESSADGSKTRKKRNSRDFEEGKNRNFAPVGSTAAERVNKLPVVLAVDVADVESTAVVPFELVSLTPLFRPRTLV